MNRSFRVGIILAWALTLSVAGYLVWGYEKTLREGQLVLLRLLPNDPRSLMQGDYMALEYAMDQRLVDLPGPLPAYVYVQLGDGARGVFAGVGEQLRVEPGLISIRIRQRRARPSVGPNAFFFEEGSESLYETARWGGVRVAHDGTALLTSLYDDDLQLLGKNRR